MVTNGTFVSRIQNELKVLNKDEFISRRMIIQVGWDKAKTYISQKLRDRSLFREANLITTVFCFPMVSIDVKSCPFVEFRTCGSLMKSKHPIPEPIYSRYGASIISVRSLDGETDFHHSNSSKNDSRREFSHMARKFYIRDGHLFIPDVHILGVDIEMITQNLKYANDVSDCAKYDKCKSIWDYDFVCPDKLYEPLVAATLQELAGVTRQIPEDENPNMDSNIKSQIRE